MVSRVLLQRLSPSESVSCNLCCCFHAWRNYPEEGSAETNSCHLKMPFMAVYSDLTKLWLREGSESFKAFQAPSWSVYHSYFCNNQLPYTPRSPHAVSLPHLHTLLEKCKTDIPVLSLICYLVFVIFCYCITICKLIVCCFVHIFLLSFMYLKNLTKVLRDNRVTLH